MKNKLWILVAVVLIAVLGFVLWRWLKPAAGNIPESGPSSVVTEYRCSEGKYIKAHYLVSGMKLELSDGRELMLKPATASVGARYTDETGSVVFWAKQYSAFLEESGQTSFQGCVIYPLPFNKKS